MLLTKIHFKNEYEHYIKDEFADFEANQSKDTITPNELYHILEKKKQKLREEEEEREQKRLKEEEAKKLVVEATPIPEVAQMEVEPEEKAIEPIVKQEDIAVKIEKTEDVACDVSSKIKSKIFFEINTVPRKTSFQPALSEIGDEENITKIEKETEDDKEELKVHPAAPPQSESVVPDTNQPKKKKDEMLKKKRSKSEKNQANSTKLEKTKSEDGKVEDFNSELQKMEIQIKEEQDEEEEEQDQINENGVPKKIIKLADKKQNLKVTLEQFNRYKFYKRFCNNDFKEAVA